MSDPTWSDPGPEAGVRRLDDLATPRWVIDACLRVFDADRFGLDPCANRFSIVPARVAWTREDDALSKPPGDWTSHGPIYCNPPYSRGMVDAFLSRVSAAAPAVGALALVKVDPSTEWWHRWVTGRRICLLHDRPRFGGLGSSGRFASVLVWYPPQAHRSRMTRRFVETCHDLRIGEVR